MYTSNSEFDLETRVQITNEVPAVRTFQQMHHSLQNETWKWLIGEEDVDYDLPVGGKYIEGVDADGNPEVRELIAPPVKIVNGKQAASYGPSVGEKWNPDTESYEENVPKFHRTEINGTLAVEQDLFLHEIYRYLNCIYPDHPDWLNLLTRNEVLDAFNNAAAMVDYKPNNEFFKLVADSIGDVDGSEEFKLNLRNLTSNAARRKFFGSTLGYRMTGHDAYEDIMVFPIGKNLTIAPMVGTSQTIKDDLGNETVIYKQSDIPVKNYIIDTFDERYQTLFRRIDFNGDSRDTSFVSSNSVMLPAYTLPGFEDFVFEFVSAKDGYSTLQDHRIYKENDFSFFTNHNEDIVGSIANLKQYNILEPKITTIEDKSYVSYVSSDDKIYGFQLSALTRPSYLKLYKYKSIDELEQFQKDHNLDTTIIKNWDMVFGADGKANRSKNFFSEYLRPIFHFCAGYDALKGYESIRDTVEFAYNSFVKNTIVLPPEEMIKMYGETEFDSGAIVNKVSPELTNTSLVKGDFISFEDASMKNTTTYEVVGASWGTLEATFHHDHNINDYLAIKNYSPFDELNNEVVSDDSSAIVVQNRDGDYIVLHGSLKCNWKTMSQGPFTASYLDSIRFVVKAIPETKSEQLFRTLYGDNCYDVIDEINEEILQYDRDMARARALIKQVENTLTDTPLETYEELSVKETLTAEEQESLNAAIAKLEEFAYSYWSDYKDAEEKIKDATEDLVKANTELARLRKNKELLIKDGIISFGYDSKVVFLGQVGEQGIYGKYQFLLDDGFIESFNLGNVSVLPIDPLNDAIPLERNYVNETFEKTYYLAQVDLSKLIKDTSQLGQLYSNILDDDRALIYKSTVKFEIYNEKTYTVTAQVFVDKKANQVTHEMQFLTDDAKKKFESIGVGSRVRGPGIGNAYVVSLGNNSLTLNTSIPKGGYLTYHFECPVTTTPNEVKDDPFNYKRVMNDLGIYDKVSFFDHGVYGTKEWPNVSAVVFDGDLRDKQILNPKTFRQVVKYLYGDKLGANPKPEDYLTPSIAKYTRDVFVDIKADKLISAKNYNGHTENLMNVDWLDYIQNNNELALAKENINVGANVILNTDLSGYASLIKNSDYTDEKLKTLFQTNNWDDTTIPAYVQIGTGGKNYKSYFKLMSDIFYPNVYGATFWDHQIEPTKGGNPEDTIDDWRTVGETKLKKRSTYSKVNTLADASSVYHTYENIDNPIFEIPLNEYNIQLKTFQNGKTYTIIDALFYEQGFKNITKKNELKISKADELYSNFIDAYPIVSDLKDSIADGIQYYYFADGSKYGENKADLWFTKDLSASGTTDTEVDREKKDSNGEIKFNRYTRYDIYNGGVFGAQLYHFNTIFYDILGAGLFSDVYYSKLYNDAYVAADKDDRIGNFLSIDHNEILRRLLMLKAFYSNSSSNIDKALKYKAYIIRNVQIFKTEDEARAVLKDQEGHFIGKDVIEVAIDKRVDNTPNSPYVITGDGTEFIIDATWNDPFENRLILFSYVKGNWDTLNGKPATETDQIDKDVTGLESKDELNDKLPDFFGLKSYDTLGLFWNGKAAELINVHKNYTICTTDAIKPLPLITKTEENLYYGYFNRPIFSVYSKLRITQKQDLSQSSGEETTWLAVSHDLEDWEMDLGNSFINYSYIIFNIIKLPRKYIANGSYDINLFMDPQFIGRGYKFDDYIKGNKNNEIEFNISQSAIRYDRDNNVFYTIAAPVVGSGDSETFASENEKIAIKFEEQKYFKDLKFLFGTYQTSNTQFEGSTDITKEAYIKGVALQPFSISDLSTSDKFVSIQEVDLRSIYTPLLNSRVFEGTKEFKGEVYGVTDKGEYFVSGKRTQPFSRIYDKDVTTTLNDILPCRIDTEGNIIKLPEYENVGVNFDDPQTIFVAPTYENVSLRKSIDPRYIVSDVPEFKYYKNLLVFEGLINLKKPNAIESPVDDPSTFNLVLQMLNAGDSVEGAVCLSGGGYATHTITTNIEQKALFVAVNGSNVEVITPMGIYENDEPINFDAVNNATFSKVEGIPELEGTVTNVIWDEDLNAFVATLGRNPSIGPNETDDFGLMYYKSSVAVQLTPVPAGEKPVEVYASLFDTNVADSFRQRDDGIYVWNDLSHGIEVGKITDGDNIIETELVNPNDVAFRIYRNNPNDENTADNEDDIYGEGDNGDGTHLVMREGPYIPRVPNENEMIHRSLFSSDDIDIALMEEFIFIKSKNYLVDGNNNYTRKLSEKRHWKATKLPEILDNTELFLKSHTLTGSNSVYEYVKKVYKTFAGWAFDDASIFNGETDGSVTFKGIELEDAYSREDLDYFRNAVKDYMDNHFLDYNAFKAKCKYFDENGAVESVTAEDVTITIDSSNYTSVETAITRVECDTGLPLDENFRIDTDASYKISGSTLDFVIQSKKSQNYINFDEMYYQYATIVMKYLIGEVVSENFGTTCITDINSSGNRFFFKTFYDDFFYIDKDKLYKYEDFSNMINWNVALMPAGTYLRGSYAKKINDFHTVTIKSPTTGDDVLIPVSASTMPIKFFRLKTDMYVAPDGKHIFFGGCTVPYPDIVKAVNLAGGDESDFIENRLLQVNLKAWMNDKENTGTAPMILYSDDAGKTFKILPIKQFVDNNLFSNDNFEIASFKEYDDKLLAFVKKSSGGYESSQIVISFSSATGDVDTEATLYKPMAIADNGNIHSTPAGDGTLTWSDGALGFGVDIDASEMNGSGTLNFDWTGTNSLTIPAGLVVKSATSNAVLLNKGFASGNLAGGKLRALFAISTKMDIPQQAQFLSSDQLKLNEYKNRTTGLFKVPTTKLVPNDALANRIYSSRYLSAIDTQDNDAIGYPRVDEDTSHTYYEYEIDENGVIGDVKPLKNTFGNEIKLCTDDGSKYVFDNTEVEEGTRVTPSMPQSLEDMIDADIDVMFAKTAGKNKVSAKDALSNVSTMDIDDKLTFKEVEGELTDERYSYTLRAFNINDNTALIKPEYNPLNVADILSCKVDFTTDEATTKAKAEEIVFGKNSDNPDEIVQPLEEASALKTFIENVEGVWGSTDNKFSAFNVRFELRKIGETKEKVVENEQEVEKTKDITFGLYDCKYGCFVLKTRRYIDGLFILPYTFYNGGSGISIVADPTIEYKNNGDANIATMIGDGRHSSGIYYHPMGYGGLRNNTSITDRTPWDRDPAAFENRLLKNSLGNYVYLTDGMGNLIDVYNSIKIADGTECIHYDDFLDVGYNYVKHGHTLEECYTEGHEAKFFKLYKLSETDFRIVSSLTKVKAGSHLRLRVYNNAAACWFNSSYRGPLYDENGNEAGIIFVNTDGDATIESISAPKVHFEMPIVFSYEKDDGHFENEEDKVVFEFEQEDNNVHAYIDDITETPIIFHKSDNGYMAITDVGVNGSITATYKFNVYVPSGNPDVPYSKLETEDENLKCNITSANLKYNGDEGCFNLDLTLGMSEFKDVVITYNGVELYKLPIFAIDDKIFLLKKGEGYEYYVGDAKLGPEFNTFRNNIGNFDYEIIDEGSLPLTYGMEKLANIEQGEIIIGLKGKSISKAPKYKNFSDLIYYEGVFIYKDVIYTQDNCGCIKNMKIESVASDNSSFKLQSPLGGDLAKYNDDKEHYFLYRILTIAHQTTKPENMNDPDHYYELDLNEMTTYPPDRVWFNPKGSPKPPVKVGNEIFNSENNYAYYDEEYINANDYKIRLCNEDGRYVNYDTDGNEYCLDNGDGDCSKYVYTGFDGRYVSPKPVNATCQEWYKNNIWSKNKEVNPLWQIINVKSNIKNKRWVQSVTLNKYTKSGDNQIMTTDVEYPYVSVKDITKIYVKDDVIYFLDQAENFDIEKGELQLLLSDGSNYYIDNDEFTMYGLHFSSRQYKKNADRARTQSTLQASYTINTLRDFAINVQENNTIAEITELGIFDKNHKLIAYANFPPVEYRTDIQHAAFTCIVYHGNMAKTDED